MSRATAPSDPLEAFTGMRAYLKECAQLLMTTGRAYAVYVGAAKMIRDSTQHKEKSEAEREQFEAAVTFAKNELEQGFPALISQLAVSLWSGLEACMSSFALHWLYFRPELLSSPAFGTLKIPAGALLIQDKLEAAELVLQEFERRQGTTLREGVGRFTALLEALGLEVPISDDARRSIYELSKVRNLIMHRCGIVDRQFKRACPWVDLAVGDRLAVTKPMFSKYADGVRELTWGTYEEAKRKLV
jgi:hypothetical protein